MEKEKKGGREKGKEAEKGGGEVSRGIDGR
jgi:hypothetical protein